MEVQEIDSITGDYIVANLQGDISGMVAVGKNIVQMKVQVEKGGIANIIPPEQAPEIRPRSTPVRLLPRPFDHLLDRTAETGVLATDLLSGQPVEFYGGEGFGKTSLLRVAAYHSITGTFPDGIVYLEMRDRPVEDLMKGLYDAFYETSRPYRPGEVELRQALSAKKALILIDEVPAQRRPAELQSLVNAAPACTFLFASEEQRLVGEGCAYELSGLPENEALKLFEHWVGRPLSPAEIPLGKAICANLKGNPLHIVEAAGLAKKNPTALASVAELVTESNPLKRLKAILLAGLAPEEQQMLAALAALRGTPVHRKHLPGLTRRSGALAILAALIERGIVQAHGTGVSLSPATLAQVTQSMDIGPARSEALRYFTRLAEKQFANPAEILKESGPLQSLVHGAAESGHWAEAFHLARLTERALSLSGHWGAWGDMLEVARKAATELGDLPGQAWALHQLGTRQLCLGNDAAARSYLIRALRMRQLLNDRVGIEVTRHNLNLLLPPPAKPPSRGSQIPVTGELVTQAAHSMPRPFPTALARWLLAVFCAAAALIAVNKGIPGGSSPGIPAPPPAGTVTLVSTPSLTVLVPPPIPLITVTETPTGTPTATLTETPTPTATNTPTITATTCTPVTGWFLYVIQPGDTLSALARKTGTSTAALERANCLTSTWIIAGNTLLVPVLPPVITITYTATTPAPTTQAPPPDTLPDLVIQSIDVVGQPDVSSSAIIINLAVIVKDQSSVPFKGGQKVNLIADYHVDVNGLPNETHLPQNLSGSIDTTFYQGIEANSTLDVPLGRVVINSIAGGKPLIITATVNSCPASPVGVSSCGIEESNYANNSFSTQIQLPSPPQTITPTITPTITLTITPTITPTSTTIFK